VRSIRLSLIVYFLFLLAATLGAVSWFAYQTTSQTLQAKEAGAKSYLDVEYKENCKKASADFDKKLVNHAYALVRMARGNIRFYESTLPYLAAVGAGAQLGASAAIPLTLAAGRPPNPGSEDPIFVELYYEAYHPIELDIDVDYAESIVPKGQPPEYFQSYTPLGKPLHVSRSLAEKPFTLESAVQEKMEALRNRPFRTTPPNAREAADDQKAELPREYFDEVEIGGGRKARRVTLLARPRFFPPPDHPWGQYKGPAQANAKREKGARPNWPPPRWARRGNFILQYAILTDELDKRLLALQTKLDENLEKQEAETVQTLAGLRTRFFWTFAATFLAIVIGGYWLVRVVLSPLQRLSDAVSRVSAQDFRLQVDGRIPIELKPIVARLTETLDQLKRAFSREKQAAADISHELRTPLAAMLTTVEVALRKRRPPEEYEEMLEDCRASGKQMTQLVERMLALARMDAGVDNLHLHEVDVANVAAQCAEMVRPLADARGLAVRLHAEGQTTLEADPDKLREVVTNLLHNAIEYNKPNGSIDVAVARDNGHVRLEVRDTGIGIAPEAREHIFERFYRADPSRHADTLHAGIGLAIVKGYVDLMGGSIGVDSSPAGSTFRIDFPVR
jgi:heavy metal sensor kinase